MSEDVTELQKRILAQIGRVNRRPSAIASALRRRHVACEQNDVVLALIDLEKRGLAERTTAKAWTATSKASSLIE
ncbi:MAG: hypothetical protein ACP6KW_03260 [Candidatus Thorarchaeota archaeon]